MVGALLCPNVFLAVCGGRACTSGRGYGWVWGGVPFKSPPGLGGEWLRTFSKTDLSVACRRGLAANLVGVSIAKSKSTPQGSNQRVWLGADEKLTHELTHKISPPGHSLGSL